MKKVILLTIGILATLLVAGCGHNINVQGFGIACPYGAIGYGTFSCVKDNVSVESTENTTADGVATTNKFVVGNQTTGYDVELQKHEAGR
jgi:hypothetical protein